MKTRTRSIVGLILLVGLVSPCWSLALTTFGKSSPNTNNQNQNNQNNDNNRQTGATARECASDAECAGIKSTSCLENIFGDHKMRCLCGDYKEPHNGRCDVQYKKVKALCNYDHECTQGAMCLQGNDTSFIGKRCWCTSSFVPDEDMDCSGSPMVFGFPGLLLIAGLFLTGTV